MWKLRLREGHTLGFKLLGGGKSLLPETWAVRVVVDAHGDAKAILAVLCVQIGEVRKPNIVCLGMRTFIPIKWYFSLSSPCEVEVQMSTFLLYFVWPWTGEQVTALLEN